MNRVIKFRVWDTELKQFRNDLYIGLGGLLYFSDGGRIGTVETSKYIIHQFTGLHDKNGREIYEGDIVMAINGGVKKTISFSNGCFLWGDDLLGYEQWDMEVYPPSQWGVVIGNIYENPELIK